jgi:hypothetical protein
LALESNPDFRQLRDELEEAFIQEIDAAKLGVLTMDEANVKALLLYEAKIKAFFASFKSAQKMKNEENKKVAK